MDIRTYRARTMPDALDLVRKELGPAAIVLHTRELSRGLMGRAIFGRQYEVAATADANASTSETESPQSKIQNPKSKIPPPAHSFHLSRAPVSAAAEQIRQELLDAEIAPSLADHLLDRLLRESPEDANNPAAFRRRLVSLVESQIATTGPISLTRGKPRIVALVGPTGVGKTTTIAKLAANFRLRDEKRVGLITVDTYRIAAVEQLRTYAEIIDLPMEVVANPREARAAIERMQDFDLVLMDTAGRSPRDEVRLRELRAMLAESQPDEVHLVLSAASSLRHLQASVEHFSAAGVTSLLVTKLDEATGLGAVFSVARQSGLPLSYTTDGQDVPDDIAVAEAGELARQILATGQHSLAA